jgi:phosphate uptake regulator
MQTAHTDKRYEEELKTLREEILYMGGLVEDQIQKAVKSLVDRDSNLAEIIIERDHEVNRLDVDIDELCIRLLALHQPSVRAQSGAAVKTVHRHTAHGTDSPANDPAEFRRFRSRGHRSGT